MNTRVTADFVKKQKGKRKLSMLTAYDYPTATFVDKSGVDMILVGDSLAMVVLGHNDTLSLTVEEMAHHCKAVVRGAERALVIGDMPFLSYEAGVEKALESAGKLVKEAGVRAVKLEGAVHVLPQVCALVGAGIPVQGHIGLTPQRIAEIGGFKVRGKTAEAAKELIDQALSLEDAGCFSIVLECIPAQIAARITGAVSVPTIGIGAGPECDGQVLVTHDVLGLYDRFVPKFIKQYAQLGPQMLQAFSQFREDVEKGVFPAQEHCFTIDAGELDKLS